MWFFFQLVSSGISLIALCMEVFRFTITWCYSYRYGYPLMQYLEYPALLFQQCFLVYLVLKYDNHLGRWSLIAALGLVATIVLFLGGFLPRFWLAILLVSYRCGTRTLAAATASSLIINEILTICQQPLCTPIGGFSKIIQAIEIIRTKDSAAVSLATWLLSSYTSLSESQHSPRRVH